MKEKKKEHLLLNKMGRGKIVHKSKTTSISLPAYQIEWIELHPDFNLSKYCKLSLKDYIDNFIDVQLVIKEVENEKNVK